MKKVNKKWLIASGIIILLLPVMLLAYKGGVKSSKINKINQLMAEFKDDYDKRLDVYKELTIYAEDEDEEISQLARDTKKEVNLLYKSKTTYERLKEEIEDAEWKGFLLEGTREEYAKKLQEGVSKESKYYEEAQQLIAQLTGDIEDYNDIIIEYYSNHYEPGTKELSITLKNTSGKDIEYLSLDIFEIDSVGNILNSDWTNTSSLIKDNANITIDTYFDYKSKDSKLNFEIRDIRYR